MRKVPAVAFVARFYCPDQRTTFGLLPDFYASRTPGTLDAIEEAAAYAETAPSVATAADDLRPADAQDAVTLDAAVRWLERRITLVRATLVTVLGLFPERFAGCAPRVSAFRARLDTMHVMVALRGICEPHLHALPRPVGLLRRWIAREGGSGGHQQSMGPDPPDDGR